MSESLDQTLSSDTGFTALSDPGLDLEEPLPPEAAPAEQQASPAPLSDPPLLNWDEFVLFCRAEHSLDLMDSTSGIVGGNLDAGAARIVCSSQVSCDRLAVSETLDKIKKGLSVFCGQEMTVTLGVSDERHKTKMELREEARQHPKVLLLQTQLNAGLLDCRDTRK